MYLILSIISFLTYPIQTKAKAIADLANSCLIINIMYTLDTKITIQGVKVYYPLFHIAMYKGVFNQTYWGLLYITSI